MNSGPNRTTIRFHQVIDGIDMPPSILRLGKNGIVEAVRLTVSDPGNPLFDKSNRLSDEALFETLVVLIESKLGTFEMNELRTGPSLKVIEVEGEEGLMLVYEALYQFKQIQINAHTGQVLSFR